MIDVTPKRVAKDCVAAYPEIAMSDPGGEPPLSREAFIAGLVLPGK